MGAGLFLSHMSLALVQQIMDLPSEVACYSPAWSVGRPCIVSISLGKTMLTVNADASMHSTENRWPSFSSYLQAGHEHTKVTGGKRF